LRIRTQVIVTMLLFGIVLVIVALSAIITNQQAERADDQEKIAGNIAEGANELGYLSNDYLIYGESQQFRRWQSKFTLVSRQVAGLRVDSPEQQALVRHIQANLERLKEVFESVASAGGGKSQNERAGIDPAVLEMSWSRMAVQNRGLISDASRLSQILREQVAQLLRIHRMIMYLMLGLFAVFLLSIYVQIFRRTLGAISNLQAGTEVIGSGNLDYKLEVKRNDEIGDLSRAFNRMTANLKGVTGSKADLEREIAERKKAEEALRESERRLVLAQQAGHVGVFDWDLSTNHVVWTAELEQILGLPRGSFEGDYAEVTKLVHPNDLPVVEKSIAEHLKEHRARIEHEFRVVRPGGETRWIEAQAQINYLTDSSPGHMIGTIVDITGRKRAEELKDELIGMVSHELKTPLTVLTGSIYTSMAENLPIADRRLLLRDAAQGVERLTEIVDNLLELSRFQQDRLALEKEPTDLIAVLGPLQERFLRITAIHRFTMDFDTDFPRVLADRVRVERILSNLIDNAIKYSPGGGEVKISGKQEADQLIIGVTDKGIGISPDDQSKLFERFERLDVWTKHGIQGVGLGLIVCRLLVEAHGGRIWAISEPGKGSTFFFSLPLAESEERAGSREREGESS